MRSNMSDVRRPACRALSRCFSGGIRSTTLPLLALLLASGGVTAANTTTAVDPESSAAAVASLSSYLSDTRSKRQPLAAQPFAKVSLTKEDAQQARQELWKDHVAAVRRDRAAEMGARELTDGELKMPFFYKVFGDLPPGGHSLYISMHGGGGAPARVNDRQWENQKRLYELKEGVYVAPRAPTNTWNLWHQAHIDWFFDRLIQDMIVFEDVDPDRVYIMGYSAGGDGVFQLAPRMADRLAAAAMMAGHPNETSPLGLRNLPFTLHMGGKDAAYHRNEVAGKWKEKLSELHKADPKGYVHWVKIYPDKGHWMDREDAAAIPWMARFTRNRLPEKIVWKQDDVRHDRFYWLAVDSAAIADRAQVVATRQGSHFDVEATGVKELTILLDDSMVELDQPLSVTSAEQKLFSGTVTRTIEVIARTLSERGDPKDMFCSEVSVELPE